MGWSNIDSYPESVKQINEARGEWIEATPDKPGHLEDDIKSIREIYKNVKINKLGCRLYYKLTSPPETPGQLDVCIRLTNNCTNTVKAFADTDVYLMYVSCDSISIDYACSTILRELEDCLAKIELARHHGNQLGYEVEEAQELRKLLEFKS
ncbi:hypothetical protein DFH11DRAFT_1587306 [Phellopilus nigrolimitatus]|nr:hypothetical protein DFH11DRAFT_1587306 [Phellopilus nigrolimitatus]